MTLREEIKKQRKEYFANATFKEKVKYLLEYYGFISMGVAAVLGLVIWGVVEVTASKDSVLNGAFINLSQYGENFLAEDLGDKFLKDQKIDASKYTTGFNDSLVITSSEDENSYTSHQVLMVHMSAGELDFIVSSPDNLMTYAYDSVLVDLTTILTKEQIKAYEPYFLYVDAAIIKQRENTSESFEELANYTYPDVTKPEDMEEPIPVFIDFSKNEKIQKLYNAKKLNIAFCLVTTGVNRDMAINFLDYIMK